jgi:hypothetical protein
MIKMATVSHPRRHTIGRESRQHALSDRCSGVRDSKTHFPERAEVTHSEIPSQLQFARTQFAPRWLERGFNQHSQTL